MKNIKYKLVIFESNRKEGCMSLAKKFYPTTYSKEDRKRALKTVKDKIGKKYNFNGNHILQPKQKDVEFKEDYPDGKYVRITNEYLMKEDYWDEEIICDILLIDTKFPNIVIGHRMADCPVIIAEDRKKQTVARYIYCVLSAFKAKKSATQKTKSQATKIKNSLIEILF